MNCKICTKLFGILFYFINVQSNGLSKTNTNTNMKNNVLQIKKNNAELGIITEYAVCLVLNTPYISNSANIYSKRDIYKVADRIQSNKYFVDKFQGYKHSGNKCPITNKSFPPYDFINPQNITERLSVKTVKNNPIYKITPQVIGQPCESTFRCNFEVIQSTNIRDFVEQNIETMIKSYFNNTFHCPILFYHQKNDECKLIEQNMNMQIDWQNFSYDFSHIKRGKNWNRSTTVFLVKNGIPTKSIGEFQIHNTRDCITFRFSLNTILNNFNDNLCINEW